MGHDNERAALRYRHQSDRVIAEGMEALLRIDRRPDDGSAGALVPAT
ncbi:hypothetical protein [Actinomadura verrucosospora]|nr:hypothetical protein [Actinomadura verrucosospora]